MASPLAQPGLLAFLHSETECEFFLGVLCGFKVKIYPPPPFFLTEKKPKMQGFFFVCFLFFFFKHKG